MATLHQFCGIDDHLYAVVRNIVVLHKFPHAHLDSEFDWNSKSDYDHQIKFSACQTIAESVQRKLLEVNDGVARRSWRENYGN
jgi:hypothetical protein